MIVLVCGGRTYTDAQRVEFVLDALPISVLIHGGARGADSLADAYAERKGIPRRVYYIRRGREDGYGRNRRMLESEPNIEAVVGFHGGNGTADMLRRARARQIPIIEVV